MDQAVFIAEKLRRIYGEGGLCDRRERGCVTGYAGRKVTSMRKRSKAMRGAK